MAGQRITEFKYMASFVIALASGFLAFRSLIYFMGGDVILHIAFTNTIILTLVMLVTLKSPVWVRENTIMGVGIPLAGMYFMDLMVTFSEPGMRIMGFAVYLVTSSALVFFTYKARSYEEVLFD